MYLIAYQSKICTDMQIIDSFLDTVMSVCLTKTEIIGGSVDGTVRTFDIRIGRYGTVSHSMVFSFHSNISYISHHTKHFPYNVFPCFICREISDDLGQPVNCISMSNDGNCILASCLDSTLRLLDR